MQQLQTQTQKVPSNQSAAAIVNAEMRREGRHLHVSNRRTKAGRKGAKVLVIPDAETRARVAEKIDLNDAVNAKFCDCTACSSCRCTPCK